MFVSCKPLGGGAAEITGLDLAGPLSAEAFATIAGVFANHPVLVARRQTLTAPQLAAFARRFGPLESYDPPPPGAARATVSLSRRDAPEQKLYGCEDTREVLLMTNETLPDAAPLAVIDDAQTWHADGSHKPTPYAAVALHVVRNPAQGGETEFCDLGALYAALPEGVQSRLIGQIGLHSWSQSRNPRLAAALDPEAHAQGERIAAMFPETAHPLVCRDAAGRPHLYLSPRFTVRVDRLAAETSRALLDNLFDLMETPQFVYRHVWREGDLVLWDNRRTNHRVRAFGRDDIRSRYRATVSGAGPMTAYR